MKHTQGEWKAARAKNKRLYVYGGDGHPVCSGFSSRPKLKREANAKLIAAAPDLLEALTALEKAIPNDGTWNYQAAAEAARKAIKKATE